MDQILPRVWIFDRFTLDLSRGGLRAGNEDVDLRPKAFEVLCCLVENAGRLVSKRELIDTVWGQIAVSDDSLVQCVRELRLALGDDNHRLIKTVQRRGYLFDAPVSARPSVPISAFAQDESERDSPTIVSTQPRRRLLVWGACVFILGGSGGVAALASSHGWLPVPIERLFAEPEIALPAGALRRLAALAAQKELPLPPFHILQPSENVPANVRAFVGVWVSDDGWTISRRQMMMIITGVEPDGTASGYMINGPSKPGSHTPGPAFSARFTARIFDRTLRNDGRFGMGLASLDLDGRITYRLTFQDGGTAAIILDPLWTLANAQTDAAAARQDGTR